MSWDEIHHEAAYGTEPTVTLPREQVERVLRVLEAVEWRVDDYWSDGTVECPWCGGGGRRRQNGQPYKNNPPTHEPDCSLAASIADHRKALGL